MARRIDLWHWQDRPNGSYRCAVLRRTSRISVGVAHRHSGARSTESIKSRAEFPGDGMGSSAGRRIVRQHGRCNLRTRILRRVDGAACCPSSPSRPLSRPANHQRSRRSHIDDHRRLPGSDPVCTDRNTRRLDDGDHWSSIHIVRSTPGMTS